MNGSGLPNLGLRLGDYLDAFPFYGVDKFFFLVFSTIDFL
jgi:hypothetical protein